LLDAVGVLARQCEPLRGLGVGGDGVVAVAGFD